MEGLTNKFLSVSSSQEYDGHHSHQHPGEDEAKSDAAVEKSRQIPSGRAEVQNNKRWRCSSSGMGGSEVAKSFCRSKSCQSNVKFKEEGD